jgi:mycofactocin precursor
MTEPTAAPTELETDDRNPAEPLVESELLVEDVSIDGMCGVY